MKFAFLLYPGIEPIDLAAIGVVSMARRAMPELAFVTVAQGLAPVAFAGGLKVVPDESFAGFSGADVLIVPGGPGWKDAATDAPLLEFLRTAQVGTRCGLCTGAMILAAAGLLEGRSATTKVEAIGQEEPPLELLRRGHPGVDVRHALLVDSGDVITGGGVSLCIDTLLYFLATRVSAARTRDVERILEYGAAHAANRARLPVVAA